MTTLVARHGKWAVICALGLALAPGLALAAPPNTEVGAPGPDAPVDPDAPADTDAPVDTFAPIDPLAPVDPPEEPPPEEPPPEEPPPEPPTDTELTTAEAQPETAPAEPEVPPLEEVVEIADPHALEPGETDLGHIPNPKIPSTGNTQMWFRSTTFLDYFGNNYDKPTNNDQFYALVNYLNLGADTHLKKTWQISTSVRVDTHNVFNAKTQPLCDTNNDDGMVSETEAAQCNFGPDYRIERFQLRFGNKNFEVTGGDFNVNFGQGIGLAVRKIADIGVDATVKGGRVDIKTKYIDLTGIGGVANRQQSDFATRQLFRDPGYPHALCEETPGLRGNKYGNRVWTMCSDIIAGGRFDAKLPGKVTAGGHYVFIWFGDKADLYQHDGMHLVGGDISRKRIGKHWDLFAGVTALMRNPQHRQYYPQYVQNGVAAYLSNSLTFGNTFMLIEGKYYDNYTVAKDTAATTVQYTQAPTLERADQIIPAASNTAGGRILLEQTLPKSRVVVYANYLGYVYALIDDDDMFDPNVGQMAHHAYVGMRWRDVERGTEIQSSVGYRWEGFQRERDPGVDPYTRKLPHADIYISKQVGKTRGLAHSVNLRAEWRYEHKQLGGSPAKRFHRGNVVIGYGLSPWFTFAFIGGFSSEFPALDGQLHDQPCLSEVDCLQKPHLWPGGEMRINFLESSFLRLFVGRQVGGLLCVNGSCRTLPDFEGVRLDLILSF